MNSSKNSLNVVKARQHTTTYAKKGLMHTYTHTWSEIVTPFNLVKITITNISYAGQVSKV